MNMFTKLKNSANKKGQMAAAGGAILTVFIGLFITVLIGLTIVPLMETKMETAHADPANNKSSFVHLLYDFKDIIGILCVVLCLAGTGFLAYRQARS